MSFHSVQQDSTQMQIDWNVFIEIMQGEGVANEEHAEKVRGFSQKIFTDIQAASIGNSKIFDKQRIKSLINGQHLGVRSQAFILEALFITLEQQDEKIAYLFDKIMNFNVKGAQGESLLHFITHKGLVQFLIDQKVDVNACLQTGDTPLHLAAFYGQKELLEVLLENGADIYKRNAKGLTPLLMAARGGSIECLECLLQKGSLLNDTNHMYCSALQLAALGGHREMIAHLLSKGVNINALDNEKNTILHYTKTLHDPILLEFLLQSGIYPNIKNDNGDTALRYAIEDENISAVDTLLCHGANPNICDQEGLTALHAASVKGLVEITQLSSQKAPKSTFKTRKDKPLYILLFFLEKKTPVILYYQVG